MKLCPYCSKEMADAAIVCARCGRDWKTGVSHVAPAETVQPASSSDWWRLWGLISIICLLGYLALCGVMLQKVMH